jgi:NADH-quinone oxidoreductase subunit E
VGTEKKMDEKLERILEKYKDTPGMVMSVLEEVQEVYGYLPREILVQVSEQIGVHLSRLFSLATFYSAFTLKPRGEHTVHVCLGTACHVRGAPKIVDELSRELGVEPSDTTDDMKFTLETVRCIGCCSLAPVMMVDKDIYGYTAMNKVQNILVKYKESE